MKSAVVWVMWTAFSKDHVAGLGVLARKYKIDLYANEQTWQAIGESCGKIDTDQKHVFEMGKMLTFGDMDIESFGVSHDAVHLSSISSWKMARVLSCWRTLAMLAIECAVPSKTQMLTWWESNHDVEILRMGNYPWRLKQRILSDHGHLSNEDGASTAISVIGKQTKRIFSRSPQSGKQSQGAGAFDRMENTLMQHDIDAKNEVLVLDTSHVEASPLYHIWAQKTHPDEIRWKLKLLAQLLRKQLKSASTRQWAWQLFEKLFLLFL